MQQSARIITIIGILGLVYISHGCKLSRDQDVALLLYTLIIRVFTLQGLRRCSVLRVFLTEHVVVTFWVSEVVQGSVAKI